MSKVFARPAGEMLGLTAADTLAEHDLDAVMRSDREVLGSGGVVVAEEHTPTLDAYRWSMVIRFPIRAGDGKITHIGGFHVDITERKAMEEALKASEQRFRVLAEAHPVPLFIVRVADGEILVATPPCETLLKEPLDTLLGSTMLRFCADPQARARVNERIAQDGALQRARGAVPARRRHRVLGRADLAAAHLRRRAGDGDRDRRPDREQAHRGRARSTVRPAQSEREAFRPGLAAGRRRA